MREAGPLACSSVSGRCRCCGVSPGAPHLDFEAGSRWPGLWSTRTG